jgi:hypothetical protein
MSRKSGFTDRLPLEGPHVYSELPDQAHALPRERFDLGVILRIVKASLG